MSHTRMPTNAPIGPAGHNTPSSGKRSNRRDSTIDNPPLVKASPNKRLKTYQATVATMNPASGAIQNAVKFLARKNE